MTGTSEVEARPASAQSQDDAAQSASDVAQQSPSFGKTGGGQASDSRVWTITEKASAELAKNIEPAKRTAKALAEDQKAAGARKIGDVAQVVHGAAGQLHAELPQVAKSIDDAATALERAAIRLHERSVDDLIGSCATFARSQPLAFFGAAALTGFLAARFLKSSSDRARNPER